MSFYQGNVSKMPDGTIVRIFTCDRDALLADGWTELFDDKQKHIGWAKCNDQKDDQ